MKIDRLIGIIMLLANRGRMTAGELAERYEVSAKTIQRDMETIDQAGIPIVAYQGKDGGYEIAKDYRVDRSVLTRGQSAWIAQLFNGLSENFPLREFADLKEKFDVVQPSTDENRKIVFDFSVWDIKNKSGQKLQAIETALRDSLTLHFTYRNRRDENLPRSVEASQLIFRGYRWYLFGWCTTRKDYRLFNVQRMRDVETGARFYDKRDACAPPSLFSSWMQTSERIRFRVAERFKNKLDDHFDQYTLDGDIAEIVWPIDDWVVSLFLALGAQIEVLEPPLLRERIQTKIRELINVYL